MTNAPDFLVILGFPRSGTTLLARLLDAHPEISCPPETFTLTAAGRFLYEQKAVEGPPIGVLTGLNFLGIEAEEIYAPLREMVLSFHRRIGDDTRFLIEKTASDIFFLDVLEPFLNGHARFISLVRNPLNVIASNLILAEKMGAQLTDIAAATSRYQDPFEGWARTWVDRTAATDALVDRQGTRAYRLRYEDLTADPAAALADLLSWIGTKDQDGGALAKTAFDQAPRVGLGDFKVDGTSAVRANDANGWRKRLPRAAAARMIPILADAMEAQGYNVPKAARIPSREDAVRQFSMAAQIKRATSAKPDN